MAYRNLMITNPARLSVKQRQLMIVTDTERSVPIEDILTIMLENQQITITGAALSLSAQPATVGAGEPAGGVQALPKAALAADRLSKDRQSSQMSGTVRQRSPALIQYGTGGALW